MTSKTPVSGPIINFGTTGKTRKSPKRFFSFSDRNFKKLGKQSGKIKLFCAFFTHTKKLQKPTGKVSETSFIHAPACPHFPTFKKKGWGEKRKQRGWRKKKEISQIVKVKGGNPYFIATRDSD